MMEQKEKSAALFLDRDGTLIKDVGFLSDPAGVVLLEGVKEALHRALRTCRLYLFSNQSGIGRGYYTMEQALAVNARMTALLALPAPGFSRICMAPESPDAPAVYRKPSPKFIRECIDLDGLDPARCWMIGDRLSDLQAGVNAGIRAVLIRNPDYLKAETQAYAEEHRIPQFGSLAQTLDALDIG